MGERGLKDIQIIFDKEKPQKVGTKIKITAEAESKEKLEYKFITGKSGVWAAIQDYSKNNSCLWEPKSNGNYTIMVQARQVNKKISLDHLAKEEYPIIKREVMDFMNNDKKDNNNAIKKDADDKTIKNSENEFKKIIKSENSNLELLDSAKLTKVEKDELEKSFEVIDLDSARKEAAVTCEVEPLDREADIPNDDNIIDTDKLVTNNYKGDIINKSKLTRDSRDFEKSQSDEKEEVFEYELNTQKDNSEKISNVIIKDEKIEDKSENVIDTEDLVNSLDKVSKSEEVLKEPENIAKEVAKKSEPIISDVVISKDNLFIGEKCTISVKTFEQKDYLYKFFEKKFDEWKLIRDYDSSNSLTYTANECGNKEILIQCKSIDSKESFDDDKTVAINVAEIGRVEIKNIKCTSSDIVVSEELKFEVEAKITPETNNKEVVLYKFYKISKNGKSMCLQDYSTSNSVSYIENVSGEYRLLCLAKTILSDKEYDDRALLVYNVKPYKDIKIESFVADLNSPQASETNIKFTSEITGGNKLMYRYRVNGPIAEDTGYILAEEFEWNPTEPGEYEIILYVKDESFDGDAEDSSKIAFTIEKRGKKPIKILDVIVNKEKRAIINENINVLVKAEGATSLLYSFIVNRNNSTVKEFDYSKTNWFDYIPKETGDYEIEILIKDKYSEKEYDTCTSIHLKVLEYLPGEIDYVLMPYNSEYLVGDSIELECIAENTENVLVKYETKINGHEIEDTDFCKNKKLRFTPKIAGKYTIEIFAKNVACTKEYDTKKQVNIYVEESAPVIDTKIIPSSVHGKVNEEFSIDVQSRGGKDVCYEFYLMQNNNWKKVQNYSKKNFYSFIPFISGTYRILALSKSYYKKVNYEDYDELTFTVEE